MKLLIVSRHQRSRSFETLFEGLRQSFDKVDVHKLDKGQVHDIRRYVRNTDFSRYDRVLFDVPLRRIGKASKYLRNIEGLVFYEEDACQELVEVSKFSQQFSREFAAMGNARVIVTSYFMRDYLQARGIDALCIAKAFDDGHLSVTPGERDIALGFIGRVKSEVYSQRREILEQMQALHGLQMLRTETPDEYLQLLNRIQVFFSADIGFNEYMAKNFEAMACGSLLMAKRQPSEDARLGLIDMLNVVHYDTLEEAQLKYRQLQDDPRLLQSIAAAGAQLVHERHGLSHRVAAFSTALRLPAKPVVPFIDGFFQRLWQRLGDLRSSSRNS
jgi:hypothetical protein